MGWEIFMEAENNLWVIFWYFLVNKYKWLNRIKACGVSEKIVPQPFASWVCVISLPLVTHVSLKESISLCCMGWKREKGREMVSLKERVSSSFLRLREPFYLILNFFHPPFLIQHFLIEFFFCICSW